MEKFTLFKKFNDFEQANALAQELKSKGVECRIIDDSPSVDITFTRNLAHQSEAQLMIKKADFDLANKVLDDHLEDVSHDINKDHYLFDFSNEELFEVLSKPDEWNSYDYKLSQRILKERGQSVNDDLLNTLKENRIKELSQPYKRQVFWVLFGYFLSLCGGFLGLIIGWFLWTTKKTLPNGEKVYSYTAIDRKHGKRIFTIGAVLFPIVLILKLWSQIR